MTLYDFRAILVVFFVLIFRCTASCQHIYLSFGKLPRSDLVGMGLAAVYMFLSCGCVQSPFSLKMVFYATALLKVTVEHRHEWGVVLPVLPCFFQVIRDPAQRPKHPLRHNHSISGCAGRHLLVPLSPSPRPCDASTRGCYRP